MSKKSNLNSGISAAELLGIVFVTLKLTGTITWSWWWVTAPFWIPMAVAAIAVCSYLLLK